MDLHIASDDLASCVSCGLCLPHCPTFRVTGEERYSPRGRIEAMRQVQSFGADADAAFVDMMDTCVGCRGCESACPSGVSFGAMMEATRETLASRSPGGSATTPRYQPWWRRLGYRALAFHRPLLAGSALAGVAQRLRVIPPSVSARLGLPARLPVAQRALRPSGRDVWLFTGCVMDAWMRDVHAAAQRVLEATGNGVALPKRLVGGGCCGALAAHAGLTDMAATMARRVMASMPGDAPILVDSAGCGATLKDYGHLLGDEAGARFAARVRDINEWLAEQIDRLPPAPDGVARPVVAVQDPCHLRHVQRAHLPVRALLGRYVEVVELDDDGLCCGAGGAFSVVHPDLAADIRARKVDTIARAGAPLVASANPGCSLHLQAAGLTVRHPVQIVDDAIAARPTSRSHRG